MYNHYIILYNFFMFQKLEQAGVKGLIHFTSFFFVFPKF